jgi:hypothetical protein
MKKFISIILIVDFLFVDLLFFHDIFKPGETTSIAQYLTGILSLPVFAMPIQELLKHDGHARVHNINLL